MGMRRNWMAASLALAMSVDAPVRADQTLQVKPVITTEAQAFGHEDVKLLDGPFLKAQEVGKAQLLKYDPDRLIAPCYEAIGLKPKKPRYGGWEAQGVSGHILGHWLSATARMAAATGDAELKTRLDYAVSELAMLQSKRNDGYVSGFPVTPFEKVFSGDFTVEAFNLAGHWVPWYTMHKIYAGLIDAYEIGGNKQALEVVKKLADWAKAGTDKLNDEQFQKMLTCEQGGMCESMAELYAITGEKKYLDLARRFTHHVITDPLAAGRDQLTGIHANAQIPKIVGAARVYELTGDAYYHGVANYFWEEVTGKRSYVIGGNSLAEHFQKLGTEPLGPNTAETCNTYNMLRLTRDLMDWKTDARYADYYERALYNQILATLDLESGDTMYFVSTKPGHFKVYGTDFDSMWCCTGTGLENPGRYAEGIYSHNAEALWVNLFVGSELNWKEKGLTLRQETKFPEEPRTQLKVTAAPAAGEIALKVRVPYWAAGPVVVKVNGAEAAQGKESGWLTVKRAWKTGDVVDVSLPMNLHLYKKVDDASTVAVMYGPVVLAAQMGRENFPKSDHFTDQNSPNNMPAPEAPVIVSQNADPASWLKPVEGRALAFKTEGAGRPSDVMFIPFYALAHERYTIYIKQATPVEWTKMESEMRAKEASQRELDARTVDQINPGEQQPDIDHAMKGEKTSAGNAFGRSLRHATDGGWFSYQVKVSPEVPNVLRVTYWGGENGPREFAVLVEGQKVGDQKLANNKPNEFFDVDYPMPEAVTKGKEKVEVKFAAKPGNFAGGIFGLRVLKK